ncbi:MAG: DUF2723 domain-containing protein [Candidatus Saganbacteria bacterium]|nr:DUF2723 domain-containing protein [Candidatus Saganbacteria bacterium]
MSTYDRIVCVTNRTRSIKYAIGALIFLGTLAIYLLTLCPTVPPRDSGELITAAYTLGITHPPGYPVYTVLGKLFTYIPWGNIAWRVNFMSAVFASATVTLLYYLVLELTGSLPAATLSALSLAFAPFFWSLALVAEVFQLNAFFTILNIYLLWLWSQKRDFKLLAAFAFIWGLSFSHHHTTALLGPGFLYIILVTDWRVLTKLKNWAILAGCFLVGLIPYIYLPLRSLANPYIDWGDPQTTERFLDVVLRRQFGSMRLDPALPQAAYTLEMIMANLKVYFGWLIKQFTIVGFILGLTGTVIAYFKDKKLFFFNLLLFLFSGLIFVLLAAYPFHVKTYQLYCGTILRRFMLPSFIVFAIWLGLAAAAIINWRPDKRVSLALGGTFLLIPAFVLAINFKTVDMSRYYYVEDLINNILRSAKPNSIIFANADTSLFSLWYMQGVEGKRPDIRIISSTPQKWRAERIMREAPGLMGFKQQPTEEEIQARIASYPNGFVFFHDLIRRNAAKMDIYTDLDDSKTFGPMFDYLAPNGLLYKFLSTKDTKAKLTQLKTTYHLWDDYKYTVPLSTINMNDYSARELLTFYAEGHNFAGLVYVFNRDYSEAVKEFNKALALYPNYPSAMINLQKLHSLKQRAN